jgi:predicted dehydrogenase/aryl-alcohol dehydrogenase-like predicted oxidoreductase
MADVKLGWGILGTGGIAKVLAEAISASETGRLVAVGSRNQESAEGFGEKHGIPNRYGSYEAVLADPEVDAVYISLPNHLHAEWTIRCAEAGKHILCEKPFATNVGEAMAMVEAARAHGVFLLEAFMYRCAPQTARLAELIRAGTIGEVRLIQANFSYNLGPKFDNIRLRGDVAGGGIMDVGCYAMSMARLVAGAARGADFADPIEVKGSAHIGQTSGVDEWAVAAVKFPGDILANLACGAEVASDSTLRIWGSEGSILVPNPWFPGRKAGESGTIRVQRAGQSEAEEIVVPGGAGLYTVEVDTVAAHIADRQAPAMRWADSLGNMKALDRWRREIGLVFEREKPESDALALPFTGRPLARQQSRQMRYGRIAGIEKPVSRLVMGTMMLSPDNLPAAFALLDHFYEIGGSAVDTAYVYGMGRSERALGQWLRRRDLREEIVVIGKAAATARCTPEMVTRELMESLDRLDIGAIDLFLMHRDNVDVPVGEFVECLNEHRRAGRIGAFGGSNWTTERLEAANDYAAAHDLAPFVASSPNFSLARWNEPMWADCVAATDDASRAWHERTGMPLFAWSSQASGFFTGRFGEADRDDPALRGIVRTWFSAENFARLERARELAERRGVTATQIALAYVLCQPLEIYALIGPQSIEETRTSALALAVELSPEELRWLEG